MSAWCLENGERERRSYRERERGEVRFEEKNWCDWEMLRGSECFRIRNVASDVWCARLVWVLVSIRFIPLGLDGVGDMYQ